MKYEVFMPITPPTATAQHKGERVVYDKRTNRPMVMHYMKYPQRKAHDLYVKSLRADIATRKDLIGSVHLFHQPVIVEIDFMFPHGANTAKRDKNKVFPRAVRPDVDNMAKGLLDCLTEVGIIQDDALVFDLRLRKFNVNSKHQGVRVSITDDIQIAYQNDGEREAN